MKFAIQVNEGPYQHQATDSAYQFTKAALDKGHEISRVFFYHDGVNNGTRYGVPPQDDRNITQLVVSLDQQFKSGPCNEGPNCQCHQSFDLV